jgi:hypothetical protein
MIRGARSKVHEIAQRIHVHGAYERLFSTPDGEIVLRDILRQGYATRTTFVAGDQQQTALNEGSRRLALSILRFARKDHAQMVDMIEKGVVDED